jgi:hypothetical protein
MIANGRLDCEPLAGGYTGRRGRRAMPQRTLQEKATVEQMLRSVEADLSAASAQVIWDEPVRAAYRREIRRALADIERRFASGEIPSVQAAAEAAHEMRNMALTALRTRTSPLGLVIAKNLKDEGPTLNALIAKRTIELYGERAVFADLTAAEQGAVYARILERSAVSNGAVDQLLRRAAPAAKGLMVLSIAISVYEIATAEEGDRGRVAAREGLSLGAGIAGGAGGGALAGLACGPGAPVCVTIGAFVGGALAAFGVQFAFGH